MLCPNLSSPQWKALVERVGETEAWREFLKYGEIPSEDIYKSIKTKTTEEIAEGINKSLIQTSLEIKYTSFIQSALLNQLGDLTPDTKLEVSPSQAFNNIKTIFDNVQKDVMDALTIVKSEADFKDVISSAEFKSGELTKEFPIFEHVKDYNDLGKALSTYSNLYNNFDKYRDTVVAELAQKGIKLSKDKLIANLSTDPAQNDNDVNDDISVSETELGEQFKDGYVFQTNPRDTASVRVRLLLESIKTGESELGLPLYADPEDVLADMLFIGSKMKISGFNGVETKYSSFKKGLEDRAAGRPYLKNLIAKLDKYASENKWDVLNDILTFATKAYANEGLILYKLRRFGNEIVGTTDVKVTTTNQDTVQSQVAKDWSAKNQAVATGFFDISALDERKPNKAKVNALGSVLEKAKYKESDKVGLFKEFFSILGIEFTDKDLEYIVPRLPKAIDKSMAFDRLFSKNNMLDNIHKQYVDNMNIPFEGQYGFQNERRTMNQLAMLYYEANPSRYNVVSSRTSDNKNKYLYIQPSYVENVKRVWQNDTENQTSNHKLHTSAFVTPNLEFWKQVKQGNIAFSLDYFSGIREQGDSKVGKVRKSLSSKEQAVAMLLGHQENMTTGSYLSFTLSDKSTSIQTKMTKTFFVDGKNIPVGLSKDFTLSEKKVKYTESFRDRLYNTFVTPEISRIQKAIESPDVNLESFDIASKLFYIVPSLNTDERLDLFREALYSGKPIAEYKEIVSQVVLENLMESTENQLDEFIKTGIISVNDKGGYTFPLFNTKYVSRFKDTKAVGKELALLMLMDLNVNYMNAQVKNLQFLSADPMLFFKKHKGFNTANFNDISSEDKLKLVSATWDEFSKRAAGFIAPGGQGNWFWKDSKGKDYGSQTYTAVTAQDVKIGKAEITDAQEFVTVQEHIDFLMSEGRIPLKVWEKITAKINGAKPGGYYDLSAKELNYILNPSKPVYFNSSTENNGLSRLDYVKSSRYPLIPQHEAGSERDKLRIWMEKNKVNSVNFISAKKLGRPKNSVSFFNAEGNFVEPDAKQTKVATQVLSREGLRTQQEIPDQKDMIATISQMNRTLFDGLLAENFKVNGKTMSGLEAKRLKEAVRSRLFELKSLDLSDKLGNVKNDHRGLYELLKDVILTDTTGSYNINDLKALELDPVTNKFKKSLELQFKSEKFQSMLNSLVNKNVMLKTDGTSFIQVSGVGAKYTLDQLGKGVQSDIIWSSNYLKNVKKGQTAKLGYIKNENGKVSAAQAIVSQYITDVDGKVIDLAEFIIEKDSRKILDMSKIDPKLLQLAASRIPNQSHPSMLPIEVVGFLPSYMKNTIIVPDGITAQMGSDFDVDKLFAYMSKALVNRDDDNKITSLSTLQVPLNKDFKLDSLSEEELNQLYRDIHWSVLTNPATFDKITGSVDMDDISYINTTREDLLKKYDIPTEAGVSLPLNFTTSIKKYNDNRSSKDGVGIYANYSSAQADFQSIGLKLGYKTEDGDPIENPIKVKFSKKDKVASDLLYIGRSGASVSSLGQKRTIGDNINMKFTESVDNVKNQNLHKFNWTDKAMGPIGAFDLLTDEKNNAVSIDFSTNLTSQNVISTYFDYIDQRRDSFGQFESNAEAAAELKLKEQLATRIAKYYKGELTAKDYLEDADRDNVLDPETLQDTWLIGKALEAPAEKSEKILAQLAKDLKFKDVDAMMLKYYEVQYDALNLFVRLQGLSKELNTVFGSSYVYTKGIGPNVFTAKQKLNQLAKLITSSELLGIEDIGGELVRDDSGFYDLDPKGEIGYSIYNSLIKVQELYAEFFPISSGKTIDELVDALVSLQGVNDKNSLSKSKYLEVYNNTFKGIKSYLYTHPDLELFANPTESRSQLINGETSIGNRILAYKTTKPELSNNGFLRNIEVKVQYKAGNAHTISFRSPFGSDINSKKAITGFYEMALSEDPEVRQLAKDLAIYPFLTGDAGNIGRFIPIDYYMSDKDFSNAIGKLYDVYATTFLSDAKNRELFLQQVVQNNADTYSKSYRFSSNVATNGETTTSLFKRILQQKNILGPTTGSLAKVNTFKITRGDIESFDDDKSKAIADSFKVPVTTLDRMLYADDAKGLEDKYPDYITVDDVATYANPAIPASDNKYLYKRTSSIKDPVAVYTRIPILGFGAIKEYDYNNPISISAIKNNNVDDVDGQLTSDVVSTKNSVNIPEEPFTTSDTTIVSSLTSVKLKATDGTYDILHSQEGVLGERYTSIEEAIADAERLEATLPEEQPTYETVNYGGKDYIIDDNTYFNVKEGGKGAEVKDKNLENKLRLTRAVQNNPERVVNIKVGSNESSYYVVEDRIFSLQPTSFGKEIVSEDIRNRVFSINDAKLEDKPVDTATEESPTIATFTYNGTTVNTEFPLSSEQSEALKKLIDFVETGIPGANSIYDDTYTLEGYAGTGKTSIIGVLDRYISSKNKYTSFVYMAPTHAATVALGLNVVKYGSKYLPMTVASSLLDKFDPISKQKNVVFTKKFNDRIKGISNVIVLDEASMLSAVDFERLVKASKQSGHKLIFMGDPKQIPEVTPGVSSKNLAKAFDNPNKSQLSTVFRTKDNNILNVLTNIRNNTQFKEYQFENTDRLKQLSRGDYNKEIIADLQNNLEDTMIINYSNAGVAKANQAARSVLNFDGELKSGEKIVGYAGSNTKQVEKGHLANSVSYIIEKVTKTEEGPVLLETRSKVLKHLADMGVKNVVSKSVNTYLQLSERDVFDFNLTNDQLEYNKNILKGILSAVHNLNELYKNKKIGYNDYVLGVYLTRDQLSPINTGSDYIYNPATDSIENHDKLKHKGINQNLVIEKGLDFGYAVTVHKSQGMTIPNVYFDITSLQVAPKIDIMRDGKLFNTEKNALYYVGMSRASNKLVIPRNDQVVLTESNPKPISSDQQLIDLLMIGEQINIDGVLQQDVPALFGTTEGPVASYKTVLNNMYKTGSPFNKALIQLLAKSNIKPVTIVLSDKASDPGLYSPTNNTITINPRLAIGTTDVLEKGAERLQEVVLHELLHHVTVDMLKADPATLTIEQRKWVVSIKNMFGDVQKKMLADPKHAEALQKAIDQTNLEDGYLLESDKSLYYGLTNVFDFVSMLMTDKGFQEFMNNTPYTGDKNIFERFLEILSNLLKELGIAVKDNSVLKEGVGSIVGLIQSTTEAAPVQKSIRTKSYKQEMIEDSLNDIITSLDIKTKC